MSDFIAIAGMARLGTPTSLRSPHCPLRGCDPTHLPLFQPLEWRDRASNELAAGNQIASDEAAAFRCCMPSAHHTGCCAGVTRPTYPRCNLRLRPLGGLAQALAGRLPLSCCMLPAAPLTFVSAGVFHAGGPILPQGRGFSWGPWINRRFVAYYDKARQSLASLTTIPVSSTPASLSPSPPSPPLPPLPNGTSFSLVAHVSARRRAGVSPLALTRGPILHEYIRFAQNATVSRWVEMRRAAKVQAAKDQRAARVGRLFQKTLTNKRFAFLRRVNL